MEPRIITSEVRCFIGMRIETTLADNAAGTLWRSFMPRRKEVTAHDAGRFYSIQVYTDFARFTPQTLFEKWAAVEVRDAEQVPPAGMHLLVLPPGTYAQFVHRGLPSQFGHTLQKIFSDWLPSSAYDLDNRPHMEVMSEGYDPGDLNAEEEVWIPVMERLGIRV